MAREDPTKVTDQRVKDLAREIAMHLSEGRSFQAAGKADAKVLGCLCMSGRAWSQSDLRVSDDLEG